jgi:hypothetical protein
MKLHADGNITSKLVEKNFRYRLSKTQGLVRPEELGKHPQLLWVMRTASPTALATSYRRGTNLHGV